MSLLTSIVVITFIDSVPVPLYGNFGIDGKGIGVIKACESIIGTLSMFTFCGSVP